jgi:hypothetical protein
VRNLARRISSSRCSCFVSAATIPMRGRLTAIRDIVKDPNTPSSRAFENSARGGS